MKLIDLHEEIGAGLILEPVYEATGENGPRRMYLEGIHAQSEVVNGNRRRYPNTVLSESVANYNQDFILRKRSIGELNHPEHVKPNPDRAAIFIKSLVMEGNDAVGRSEVLDNLPCGKIVYNLRERGVELGVSTRGLGALMEDRKSGHSTVTRYRMTAIDAVLDPSAPNAIPKAIMESAEWMRAEGQLTEATILDEMVKASKLDNDDKVQAFLAFMSRLSAL